MTNMTISAPSTKIEYDFGSSVLRISGWCIWYIEFLMFNCTQGYWIHILCVYYISWFQRLELDYALDTCRNIRVVVLCRLHSICIYWKVSEGESYRDLVHYTYHRSSHSYAFLSSKSLLRNMEINSVHCALTDGIHYLVGCHQ